MSAASGSLCKTPATQREKSCSSQCWRSTPGPQTAIAASNSARFAANRLTAGQDRNSANRRRNLPRLPGQHPQQAASGEALSVAPPQADAALPAVGSSLDAGLYEPNFIFAHAAGCYAKEESVATHTIGGGANVIQLYATTSGWCGNGQTITSGEDDFANHLWSQYPYCNTDVENHSGWDGSHAWAHDGVWATQGIYTIAIVCAPVLGSMHATIRIAANGYWDKYDDFGF